MRNLSTRSFASAGFSLVELVIALTILGIVAAVAYPSYMQHLVKSSRSAAQNEVQELSSVQEKIYLNANAYTAAMTTAYNGTNTGGLGKTSGRTEDGNYALTVVSTGQSYTITATPVAGTRQANDGAFSIASTGARTCTHATWCPGGSW